MVVDDPDPISFTDRRGQDRAATPLQHPTNTTHERRSLGSVINLSDAHCRQPPTRSQRRIISRLPELFAEAQLRSQLELEDEFVVAFMELAGEKSPSDTKRHLLSYSASCAITMATSYCKRKDKRVALIEPAFDNIPSILRREGVDLVPLREPDCVGDRLRRRLADTDAKVVWQIAPNNPTGWTLDEDQFRDLVTSCVEQQRILVLDMSFRFFSPALSRWSQYEILDSSGVSYLVLEDTGKTFSTNELKVGMTVCSEDLYPEMYRLHDDLLQGVSPLALRVITELLWDSRRPGRDDAITGFVEQNRRTLRQYLADAPLEFMTRHQSPVSVDWVRLDDGLDGEELCRALAGKGVEVLPGANFYWSNPDKGRQFVRIALARQPELVRQGAAIIRDVSRQLRRTTGR